MDNIKVTLLHHTPLSVCVKAIRTCWDSHCKSDTADSVTDDLGNNDKELIHRIGNINKHKSVLEHLHYSFDINGISRACLQELARHRLASLSVKSTRYTLKELKSVNFEQSVDNATNAFRVDYNAFKRFLVTTGNDEVDSYNRYALAELQAILIDSGLPQDVVKYMLPEAYRTSLIWSINARSLQNFLELRSSKAALKEIQILAGLVFSALPDSHRYLFVDYYKR